MAIVLLLAGAYYPIGITSGANLSLGIVWSYRFPEEGGYIESVSISSDGGTLAAGTVNGEIMVYSKGGNFWTYPTGRGSAHVAVSSDGQYIAGGVEAGSESNGGVYVFAKNSSTPLWSYFGLHVWDVDISSDGKYIVAGSAGTVWGGRGIYLFDRISSTPLIAYPTDQAIGSIAVSTNGDYFAAGGDGHLFFFNRTVSSPEWSARIGGGSFIPVDISFDGDFVVAGAGGGTENASIFYFHRRSSTPLWKFNTDDIIWSISMDSNGIYIAAACDDGYAYAFQNSTFIYRYPLFSASGSSSYLNAISMSSDGAYFASVQSKLHLFSPSSTSPVWEYDPSPNTMTVLHKGVAVISTSSGVYVAAQRIVAPGTGEILLFGPSEGALPIWVFPAIVALIIISSVVISIVLLRRRQMSGSHTPKASPALTETR